MQFDSCVSILSDKETESEIISRKLGMALCCLWIALNKYLMYNEEYATSPNTFLASVKQVGQGIMGVYPLVAGIAYASTTMIYMSFHFRDFSTAQFTMFYTLNGDTQFDTITGASQFAFYYTMFFSYFWIMFGFFIINKIALAMVEEGYLRQKRRRRFDWLFDHGTKAITEAQFLTDQVTAPQALKLYLIQKRTK